MSWTARITKAPDGELRLQFSEPLRHIDMDRATARQLAALLVVAAEGKRSEPIEASRESGVQACASPWSADELPGVSQRATVARKQMARNDVRRTVRRT